MDQPEVTIEALLEWLDDRIAVSPDAGSRLLFLQIRERLAQLEVRDRQLHELIAAMHPNGMTGGGASAEGAWVVEGDVAARVIREVEGGD